MTEPDDRSGAPAPAPPAIAAADHREQLYRYFLANRDRFTSEALERAAVAAGYPRAEVAETSRLVGAEGDVTTDSARYTTQARVIVLLAYVATFILLVVPTGMATGTYGVGPVILGVLLLIAGGIGLALVGRRRRVSANAAMALTSMLAIPFVLLVIVAGSCVWATAPQLLGAE
jgi:hypothetical protein